MTLEELHPIYDKLQKIYGAKHLHSIYNGGCTNHPDICFVFMNPTGRSNASLPEWNGIRSPWIGSKTIWTLFYKLNLLDKEIYEEIQNRKGSEWTEEFASAVYKNVEKHKIFITNLGKCTQVDARELPDCYFEEYLDLLLKEIEIINPKVVVLLGNQVSSIVLNEKIAVSLCRKKKFIRNIEGKEYAFYCVFYPVGNGRFNVDKSIEDIKWIIKSLQ